MHKSDKASSGEGSKGTPNNLSKQNPVDHPSELRSLERQSFLELTRDMARLPLDQAAAALETSAAIAGVSLRASIEFLRAVPNAAQILEAAELRFWGDMGRRVAMGDVETAVS